MTAELATRLAGRRVVASISGGKDSAALSLWLGEQGIEHERVHMLTGWDADVTMDYIRGPLTKALGPITEIRGDLLLPDLARRKGIFPSRQRRYCTDLLKMQPLARYLATLDDPVSAVGIRAGESEARSKLTEWEWSDGLDCEVWRPLLAWTVADVIEIHRRHDLAPNPLYLRGAERVGCWPCIMSRKSEIRLIADTDPARIDLLRDLEAEVTARGREITQARGEVMEHPRTFFQAALGGKGVWPIDRVVEWSRTTRGGKREDRQEELFAGMNDGCLRWGLCESASPEPARTVRDLGGVGGAE